MIKASIIGSTGYAGGELLRLLLSHGGTEVVHAVDINFIGQKVADIFPYLKVAHELTIEALDAERVAADSDVVFMAMPHGKAIEPALIAYQKGKKVIDIGADFRLTDPLVYKEWYGLDHGATELLAQAVYGLPEIYRDKIKGSRIVANPGCYPTASILALYPLLKNGLVKKGSIIIDAKSGVSGAGRVPNDGNVFCTVDESFKAYKVADHRHTPEIEQVLSNVGGAEQVINFTPHLVPMNRGILATAYADLISDTTGEELTELYQETYQGEYFIKVHKHGNWPQTKWTLGTNDCHIAVTYDKRTKRAIACSAIDNLVKGAAGQAIQNMNLLFGLEENSGLKYSALVP